MNFLDSIYQSIQNEVSSSRIRVNHNLKFETQCITISVWEDQHRDVSIDIQGNTTHYLVLYFEIDHF